VVRSEGKTTADPQTVNFALASLGRIAGSPSCPGGARDRAIATLGVAFEDARSQTVRSFAALAVGLAGMGRPQAERAPLADPIRNALAKTDGDVERRGALVLSLGLLGDIRSARLLNDILGDRNLDGRLRGAAAVALGLIGDGSAVEPVRAALRERDDPRLRLDAAVGAGLLGDRRAVGILVDILRDPKSSQVVLGSATQALGRIGDRSAVEPLARILQEEKSPYPDLTRALAAVALGQIGDRSDLPVLSRLSRDVNYRAYYDAMGEVLSIL
jgi:HEAT repeat protein